MRRDDGFTLVEMLLAIALVGLLAGTLTTALILGVQSSRAARAVLEGAAELQTTTARFVTDVHTAEVVRTGAACAPGGLVVGFTANLGDAGATDVAVAIDWFLDDGTLVRQVCGGGHTQTLARGVTTAEATCSSGSCTLDWQPASGGPRTLTVTRRVTP